MNNKNLKKAIDRYGKEYIVELTKQLILSDSKATGELINSLSYEVLETANGVLLNVKAAAYLKYVDGGRKAGEIPPPIAPIMKWVDARGISKTSSNKDISTKEIAFAISKSIGKNGIKATNILKKAQFNFLANKGALADLLSGAKNDVVDLISDTLKNILK